MSGRHFAPAEQQPKSFAFTPALREQAETTVRKFPDGRQASAVIPLLDLAQRQEGWVSLAAIEHVADMLEMAPIRVQEVASFYFMFNLAPVGKHHVQVCGTTPCWLRGVDQLYEALYEECGVRAGETSADGLFSVTEVECLGACVNAPMVQIGDDYYEDLDKKNFTDLLRALKNGETPKTNSQSGRHTSEPEGGATTLKDVDFEALIALGRSRKIGEDEDDQAREAPAGDEPSGGDSDAKASEATKSERPKSGEASESPKSGEADANAADAEVDSHADSDAAADTAKDDPRKSAGAAVPESVATTESVAMAANIVPSASGAPTGVTVSAAVSEDADTPPTRPIDSDTSKSAGRPTLDDPSRPPMLEGPRGGQADDLKRISGVGPKIEQILNDLGIYHFDQVAAWTDAQKTWVNGYLKFSGRIDRERWVEQARQLTAGAGGGDA